MTEPESHSQRVSDPAASHSGSNPAQDAREVVDPRVGSALARLESLGHLPPEDQLGELEEVHRLLQDALATLDGV